MHLTPYGQPKLKAFAAHLLRVGVLSVLAGISPVQASPEPVRDNVLTFSTTATQEVTRDLLTIVMSFAKDGADAKAVQSALRQALDAGLSEARKSVQAEAMEVRTGEFAVGPRYGRDGKINGWQGSAELVLEGTDTARIAQTVGRLTTMTVSSVGYSLSRKLREKNESQVIADAVGRFRARAAELAKAFGFAGYSLAEVSVQSGEPAYVMKSPMVRMSAMSAGAADEALPVEPGKGTITVTVSGSIVLKP